jgi:hypothetical protein
MIRGTTTMTFFKALGSALTLERIGIIEREEKGKNTAFPGTWREDSVDLS